MDSCIHSAWQWLSRSGIQNESGGVARFYRADIQEYRDVSTQSTAFFISTFLRLGDYSWVIGNIGFTRHGQEHLTKLARAIIADDERLYASQQLDESDS